MIPGKQTIWNSTQPGHTDPQPFRNKLGDRFSQRTAENYFALEYSPRIKHQLPRRYPINLTLVAFRNGPSDVESALAFLATIPRWPGQYEHARKVLARWLAVYHDYGTGRRLVAVGRKQASFPTMHVQFASGEPRWNPREDPEDTGQPDPDDQRKNQIESEDHDEL